MTTPALSLTYASVLSSQGGLPSPYLRWRADDLSAPSGTRGFVDVSGNGRNSETSSSVTVVTNAIGTHSVISASSGQLVSGTLSGFTGDVTMVTLYTRQGAGTGDSYGPWALNTTTQPFRLYQKGQGEWRTNPSNTLRLNQNYGAGTFLVTTKIPASGSNATVRTNGTVSTTTMNVGGTIIPSTIQVSPVTQFCSFADLSVFNSLLSDEECAAVEADLKTYYGIS